MDISAFTFDGVSVSWEGEEVFISKEGRASVETTPENMNEICIQWLALHNPEAIKWDEE